MSIEPLEHITLLLAALTNISADQLQSYSTIGEVLSGDYVMLMEFICQLTDEWNLEFPDELAADGDITFLNLWTLQQLAEYLNGPYPK